MRLQRQGKSHGQVRLCSMSNAQGSSSPKRCAARSWPYFSLSCSSWDSDCSGIRGSTQSRTTIFSAILRCSTRGSASLTPSSTRVRSCNPTLELVEGNLEIFRKLARPRGTAALAVARSAAGKAPRIAHVTSVASPFAAGPWAALAGSSRQ